MYPYVTVERELFLSMLRAEYNHQLNLGMLPEHAEDDDDVIVVAAAMAGSDDASPSSPYMTDVQAPTLVLCLRVPEIVACHYIGAVWA